MDTIIGLGGAGCNMVRQFLIYPQYKCYMVDSQERKYEKTLVIPEQENHELYEKMNPQVCDFFEDITDNVLFILSGAGRISGTSLRILEQIHKKTKNINILYIKSDMALLSEVGKIQEKVVFSILQEYTRSGVFNRMYIVDNQALEVVVGNVSVLDYHEQLNSILMSTIHMINVFDHSESVNDTFENPHKTSRIATLGIVDLQKKQQKMFFSLDNAREVRYYFAMNEGKLKKSSNLFSEIRNFVKENNTEDTKSSYGIFSTQYEQDYGYVVSYSSKVQTCKLT